MCFWKEAASTMNLLHSLIPSLPLVYLSASLLCPRWASFSPVSSVWAPKEPPSDWTEWLRRLASATKQLINSWHSVSEWAHILSSDEKLPKVRVGRAATAGRCSRTSQGLDKRPPEDPRWNKKKANTETKTEFVTKHFNNIIDQIWHFNMLLSSIDLINKTLIQGLKTWRWLLLVKKREHYAFLSRTVKKKKDDNQVIVWMVQKD